MKWDFIVPSASLDAYRSSRIFPVSKKEGDFPLSTMVPGRTRCLHLLWSFSNSIAHISSLEEAMWSFCVFWFSKVPSCAPSLCGWVGGGCFYPPLKFLLKHWNCLGQTRSDFVSTDWATDSETGTALTPRRSLVSFLVVILTD